ncbi:MAG: LicD family protein [Methanobrevibacter sp.]|nr:LicD family protein [Methanobrevibacter sp.]MBE6490796.1 LicD family protein [Methanobrevibacter sp.]
MSFKQRFMEYFLKKSNSYNYYKKESESVAQLKEDFKEYKKTTDDYLDSYNHLFNTLFLDYEMHPKPLLSGLQGICVELLSFCDNVCKKYDLEWWIDFGNLIGTVRHGGFVPWDDDTDIGMMRKDYIKFNEVLPKEIEKYNLQDVITISYRKRPIEGDKIDSFLQLFIIDKNHEGKNALLGGVDVFPYDFLNDYDPETIDDLYYESKLDYFRDLSHGVGMEKSLENLYENLNLSMDESKYVMHGVEGACGPRNLYKMLIVEKETVFPLKRMKYVDRMFPCPNDHDTYLRKVYGDYMKIPKSIRTHSRVGNFRYVEDAPEKFQDYIDLLKGINENFEFD